VRYSEQLATQTGGVGMSINALAVMGIDRCKYIGRWQGASIGVGTMTIIDFGISPTDRVVALEKRLGTS
jgi:hypothetical protein